MMDLFFKGECFYSILQRVDDAIKPKCLANQNMVSVTDV